MPVEPMAHLISISRLRRVGEVEVSVLKLRGAVRGTTAEEFERRLAEAGQRAPYLLVDLSELEYVTSTGLGHLLQQSAFQEDRQGWLRVVAPSPTVAMILELSGAAPDLSTYPSEDAALQDLDSRAA